MTAGGVTLKRALTRRVYEPLFDLRFLQIVPWGSLRNQSGSHQTVLTRLLSRILLSRVTSVSPSARAVAPINRSAGSPG